MSTTSVLRDEVGASAIRLGDTAEGLQGAITTAERCTFAAGTAGRDYGAKGSAVETGTATLVHTLFAWHAKTERAQNAIVTAVTEYTQTDGATAGAVTGAGA